MKKSLILWVFMMLAFASFAQEYRMMPEQGKTMVYKVTAKTPMGVTGMFVKQSVKSADDTKLVLETRVSELEEGEGQAANMEYHIDGMEYVIPLEEALSENLSQLKGKFEVVETGGSLRYPVVLSTSSTLEPASMKIKANIQGVELVIDLLVRDRKITGTESVVTPAGTFDCIKMVENQVLVIMGQEQITQVTYWYGKGVGLVKQTSYAMGGLVAGELLLNRIL